MRMFFQGPSPEIPDNKLDTIESPASILGISRQDYARSGNINLQSLLMDFSDWI